MNPKIAVITKDIKIKFVAKIVSEILACSGVGKSASSKA